MNGRPSADATTEWWDDDHPWQLSGDRLLCFICGDATRDVAETEYTELLVAFAEDWNKRQSLGVHVDCLRSSVKAPVQLWIDR